MDIKTLAIDTDKEIGKNAPSGLSEENKLISEDICTKGFLLEESDVLLFQKELNSNKSDEAIFPNLKEKAINSSHSLDDMQKILSKNVFVEKKHICKNDTIDAIEKNNLCDYIEDKNVLQTLVNEKISPEIYSKNLEHTSVKTSKGRVIEAEGKENNFYVTRSIPSEVPVNENIAASVKIPLVHSMGNTVNRTHSEIILQQIKDQIIDRILVSANELDQNKTVRVVLSPTLLESTYVDFQKVGQALSIQFETMGVNSLQFLKTNQVDLQLYLQENLKQFREVSVQVKGSSGNLEQPNDGRSRNRYEYENLDDEEQ